MLTACALLFASVSFAQQPPLTPDEEKAVLRALIDRDEAIAKVKELERDLRDADAQIANRNERLAEEHAYVFDEKKLRLAALKTIAEYRTKRRPLIVKIFTFGIVRDKRDKLLEEQITLLTAEIQEWR